MNKVILERIKPVLQKFSLLQSHQMKITLEIENSPKQAGPDVYSVCTLIHGKKYKNFLIKKKSNDFYRALAEIVDGLQFHLSKANDRLIAKKLNF